MHTQGLIAHEPFEVASLNDTTVSIRIGSNIKRKSLDRLVTPRVSCTGTPYLVYDAHIIIASLAKVFRLRNPDQAYCSLRWETRTPHRSFLYPELSLTRRPVLNGPSTACNAMFTIPILIYEIQFVIFLGTTLSDTIVFNTYLYCLLRH